MKDDRIEELLRGAWQPEPPEGMRGRVLMRSREQLARRRPNLRWMLGWKPALAALGIAIVLFTHIEDNRRAARMTAMVGGSSGISAPAPDGDYFTAWREMDDMLARAPSDGYSGDHTQDGGRL